VAGLWTAATVAADPPPTGPDHAQRVLLPSAAPRLQAALDRAAPSWRLASAHIARDRVDALVCSVARCHRLHLSDAQACRAAVAGPWCVVWPDGTPPAADTLLRALATDAPAAIWHVIAARPAQPPVGLVPPPADPTSPAHDPVTATGARLVTGQTPHDAPAAVAAATPTDADPLLRMLVLGLVVGFAALLVLRGLGAKPQ